MKRLLLLILTLSAAGAVAWLSAEVAQSIHKRQAIEQRIQTLPRLTVTTLEGEHVDLSASPQMGTVILYFTTACPFCREEIEDFVANAALFEQARVVLLSAEDVGRLRTYARSLELERTDFIVGSDPDHAAARHFSIQKVPATFVYDWGGRLIRRFDGIARAAAVASKLSHPGEKIGASEAADDDG